MWLIKVENFVFKLDFEYNDDFIKAVVLDLFNMLCFFRECHKPGIAN